MSREARVSCLESLRVRNNRMATLLADEEADDAGASTDHRQGRRRPEGVHPFETALHIGQAFRHFSLEPGQATVPTRIRLCQTGLPFVVQLREAALPPGGELRQPLLELRLESGVVQLVQLAQVRSVRGVHLALKALPWSLPQSTSSLATSSPQSNVGS